MRTALLALATLGLVGCEEPERQVGKPLGSTCAGSAEYCMAVKYVVYQDEAGVSVASEQAALNNVSAANNIWRQCGIQFMIEKFVNFDPLTYGLKVRPDTMNEVYNVRGALEEPDTLLVASTRSWTGSLAQEQADAWTSLPPVGPFGVILNETVATYSPILAHEIGHYLGLDHVNNTSQVMNPVIYSQSTRISSQECAAARNMAGSMWPKMLRS